MFGGQPAQSFLGKYRIFLQKTQEKPFVFVFFVLSEVVRNVALLYLCMQIISKITLL